MKNILFTLSLLIAATAVNAQTVTEQDPSGKVQFVPQFPGGTDALNKFLANNVKYPALAADCGCKGIVKVEFVVNETGALTNAKVLSTPTCNGEVIYDGNGKITKYADKFSMPAQCSRAQQLMADEALRVVALMPRWSVGTVNDKPVKVKQIVAVPFGPLAIETYGLGDYDAVPVMDEAPDNRVYTTVEEMPQFPGGEQALMKYLASNTKYPTEAKNCDCQGTVFITFVITEDGSVVDAKVLRGVSCGGTVYLDKDGTVIADAAKQKEGTAYDCYAAGKLINNEALRVVKSMPKWKPGRQNGKPVRVQYNIPIKFVMQ